MEMKFYKCAICGQIVAIVEETGVPLVCCGEDMEELEPNVVDAAHEKHLPVIKVDGDRVTVSVGSELHPMLKEHFIGWIALQTSCGNQRRELKPGAEPKACFRLCEGEEALAAYAYCNLHGLWKAEMA